MKLYVQRHTRVQVPEGICYGQWDVPLAPSFPQELQAVQERLKDRSFDAVFSSPLSRCRLLAERLAPRQKIELDARLKELCAGHWEGLKWETIQATPQGRDWFNNYLSAAPPNGESFYMLLRRAESFLQELRDRFLPTKPHAQLLIVTHAGMLMGFRHLLAGTPIAGLYDPTLVHGTLLELNLTAEPSYPID